MLDFTVLRARLVLVRGIDRVEIPMAPMSVRRVCSVYGRLRMMSVSGFE